MTAIDGVIHRALEKRPEDRYHSAEAMAQALRSAMTLTTDTSTVTVRPTTRLIAFPSACSVPDADVDFLSFSLPDAVLSSLAGIQSLVVRSTLAGAGYTTDEGVDLKKIAAEAGVDAVLCGTLLRAGGQIRVNAQLLEASSGTILWSKTIQLELKDIFEVQDQLARAIVESLSIPLSSGDQRRLRRDLPASARAYEFYLRGNQLAYDSSMLPGRRRDVPDRHWTKTPTSRRHGPSSGGSIGSSRSTGPKAPDEHLRKADEAFKRALEINPDLSVAHNLYTNFEIESLGRAKEAVVRLLGRMRSQAADPELFAGLVIACRFCGLLDASLAADRHARRLDPSIRTSVMYTHFMRGDWERALAADADDLRWVTNWTLPLLGRSAEAIADYRLIEQRTVPPTGPAVDDGPRDMCSRSEREQALAAIEEFSTRVFDPEGVYFIVRALVMARTDGTGARSAAAARHRGRLLLPSDPACAIRGWIRFAASGDSTRSSHARASDRRTPKPSSAASAAISCCGSSRPVTGSETGAFDSYLAFHRQRRIRLARRRVELRSVRLQPEVRARVERPVQVVRVVDHRQHVQPGIAVGMRRQALDVFGDRGLLAVRHAVLPQVSLAEIGRDDLDMAAAVDLGLLPRRRTAAKTLTTAARDTARQDAAAGGARIWRRRTAPHAGTLPLREREPLPGLLGRRPLRAIEVQQPGLRAGVELELQRLIVLPRDAQPARLPHDPADAERLALVAAGVVGREVPALCRLASFRR